MSSQPQGRARRGAMLQRAVAVACLLGASAIALPSTGQAVVAGSEHTGYVEVLSKQVPLPEGRWVVASRGLNKVLVGNPGAFGTIENVVLFRAGARAVDAFVEINTNSIPVTEGWGTAGDCKSEHVLTRLNLYRTAADSMCFVVKRTVARNGPTESGPEAWLAARRFAKEKGLALADRWLTVAFRVSDRRDVLDIRYHFDAAGRGVSSAALAGDAGWTAEAVQGDAAKFRLVNDLNAWAGLTTEFVERGLHGRLADRLKGEALPMPLAEAANGNGNDGGIKFTANGKGGTTARLAALRHLVATGVVPQADYDAYAKAIEDAKPPPTIEDYYKTLVMKTASFNFFRVSVDFLLAFIVTVNAAVSGYITASIVVFHSMAQIANDIMWDRYLEKQQKDGSEPVDFHYVGMPAAQASQVAAR